MRWAAGAVALAVSLTGLCAAAERPLDALARRTVGGDQGVFVRAADGTVLAAVAADRPVHPASVTKVATTLALLERLGPAHRFVTRVLGTGPVRDGTLDGDLVVEGGRDPFLVSEHALWIATELERLGVRTVAGTLRVEGPLLFDWQPDPQGRRLRAALAGRVPADARRQARAARPGLADGNVALRFLDHDAAPAPARVLVEQRSPPLARMLKAFNSYSNNVFHPLSDAIGGPAVVERMAKAAVPAPVRGEIRIDNAAGAGTTNRLSPRAAADLLDALARALAERRLALDDVLPVAGVDVGTLHDRFDAPALRGVVVGKTGTFGSQGASALAGVVRTRRWGDVTFAILNHGVAVPTARARQDAFVRALCAEAGATPLDYRPDPVPVLATATLIVAR